MSPPRPMGREPCVSTPFTDATLSSTPPIASRQAWITNRRPGIYVFHPTIPGYPNARFPGVVIFSEIYQGTTPLPPCPFWTDSYILCTVTGPVARFARQIAGQGYICAAPSSYHEFTGPEALQYNAEDTDKGNAWKIGKVCHCLKLVVNLFIFLFFFYFFALPIRIVFPSWYSVHCVLYLYFARRWMLTRRLETGCLRRGRQSLGRLSALAPDVQWPRRRNWNVPRGPSRLSLCAR